MSVAMKVNVEKMQTWTACISSTSLSADVTLEFLF